MRSCTPFLSGRPGRMRWCWMPRRIHQTLSQERPRSAWVANGTPLSVRIARGCPYSRNVRSTIGRAVTVWVESNPWQVIRSAAVFGADQPVAAVTFGHDSCLYP